MPNPNAQHLYDEAIALHTRGIGDEAVLAKLLEAAESDPSFEAVYVAVKEIRLRRNELSELERFYRKQLHRILGMLDRSDTTRLERAVWIELVYVYQLMGRSDAAAEAQKVADALSA